MKKFFEEFTLFVLKQAWSCLFGGLLLAAILLSSFFGEWEAIARYDFLFLYALSIQIILLLTKLETLEEAKVIFLFHIVGTAMEVFKTSPEIGSWIYPEGAFFHIGNVPLFSGFMYSAVGSYLSRSHRLMALRYEHYPKTSWTLLLAMAIYANFFTHHYIWDFRILLFAATFLLFWKTTVFFTVQKKERHMPLLLGFVLISFFIWIAENVGTFSKAWIYPSQQEYWHLVSLHKLGAWFLLMIISFIMVKTVHKKESTELLDSKKL